MSYPVAERPLWVPAGDRIAAANITDFARGAERRWGRALPDYPALHGWSVEQPAEFWTSIWDLGEVRGQMGPVVLENGELMPGARWFPEARLNFAENLLRSRDDSDALVFWGEDRVKNRLSHGDLYRQVAHFAAALLEMGLVDAFRLFEQPPKSWSWWDYRNLAFRKNQGLRIDHILVSAALKGRVTACEIDKAPRKNERPSDHAPVIVTIDG